MAEWPLLKSGSPLQYPATRALRFRTHVSRFVDGGEQRFRELASPLRRWEATLELLDAEEARAIEQFFESGQGRFGAHTLTDPWDGSSHPGCRAASDELTTVQSEEERFSLQVRLEERGG
ncbi:MAG: DUF2460 domain-containing protein [Bryobacteraceae bacterium]|nr:DUF2460 domain-containing protein [Bryobacteraceae bacterium]